MNYRKITTERQFKDATGMSKKEFEHLLKEFERTYLKEKGQDYESYVAECVTEPPKLKTLGDALFFILFQKKNDMIWGSLGCIFEMAGSTAHQNFKYFLELLELTLLKKK